MSSVLFVTVSVTSLGLAQSLRHHNSKISTAVNMVSFGYYCMIRILSLDPFKEEKVFFLLMYSEYD